MPKVVRNFINNTWRQARTVQFLDVKCPLSQQVVSKVPLSSKLDADEAVQAAHEALPEWRVSNRRELLFQYLKKVKENHEDLARIITEEQGKTLEDARGEMKRAVQSLEFAYAQAAIAGTIPNTGYVSSLAKDMDMYGIREPLGVCVGITPFNFPVMIPLWMYPMATVLGNTFVLKPSVLTPRSTEALICLLEESRFPKGVVNVVHGEKETVTALVEHPLTQGVSFVGGNAAGAAIYQSATAHNKRVQCNMGAKNHAVIMPDASRARTLDALLNASFGAAGQRCMALSVAVFVGDSQEWISELVEQAARLNVGSGADEKVDVGPLITSQSKQRVLNLIQKAHEEPWTHVLLDGSHYTDSLHPDGNFIGPTVLKISADEKQCLNSVALREEFFGPVLTVVCVPDLESAIKLVNHSNYGNGTAIFTQNGSAARAFKERIHAGQIGVNVPIPVPLPMFSFTGSKESFKGSQYFNGMGSIDFYTRPKTIIELWPASESHLVAQRSTFFDTLF